MVVGCGGGTAGLGLWRWGCAVGSLQMKEKKREEKKKQRNELKKNEREREK